MTPDAIGIDALSDRMAETITADGVDISHLARNPHRTTGLYAIRTDPAGERISRTGATPRPHGSCSMAAMHLPNLTGPACCSCSARTRLRRFSGGIPARLIGDHGAIVPLSLW